MENSQEKNSLAWSDDFLIGVAELDHEHRKLIDDINRLHQELVQHDSSGKIKDTLGDIHSRMQAHFALEEHFMQEHEYAHFREHKAAHEELLDRYTDFMVHFEKDGETLDYIKSEEFLSRWIVDHILTSDKKMSLAVS